MGIFFPLPLAALEERTHDDKEYRHKENAERRGRDHAAHDAGADGALTGRTRAGCNHQRQHAEDKCHRRHQDRTKPQVAGRNHGVGRAPALGLQVLGKFDDQDRVLGAQADDGDQAHLEVNIVRQVAQVGADQGAEYAERDHQQDRDRDRPAFIQRGQGKKYRQQRKAEQHEYGGA